MIRSPWTGARVVFDGQSLNLSVPAGASEADRWPNVLMQDYVEPWANVSRGGASWTALLAGDGMTVQPAVDRLWPQADNSAAKTILIMCGGTSDILFETNTGAETMADAIAYADAARTAGFSHVIGSTIPDTTLFNSTMDTARADHNALMVADAGSDFDAVVDLYGNGFNDSTNGSNDYFSTDELHLSVNGHIACAALFAPALDTVLAL